MTGIGLVYAAGEKAASVGSWNTCCDCQGVADGPYPYRVLLWGQSPVSSDTNINSYTDTSATDVSDPNEATGLSSTSHSTSTWSNDNTVDFSWTTATDNGDDYFYYLKAFDDEGDENNLALNGFMEIDTNSDNYPDSWTHPSYASRSTDSYGGDYSLHIGYNGGSWAGVYQCKPYGTYELGKWYRAEAKFKCTTGNAAMFFGDAINYGKWSASTGFGSTICDGNWKTFGRVLYMDTDQPSDGNFCIYIYGHGVSSDDIVYDDIKWSKVQNATILVRIGLILFSLSLTVALLKAVTMIMGQTVGSSPEQR